MSSSVIMAEMGGPPPFAPRLQGRARAAVRLSCVASSERSNKRSSRPPANLRPRRKVTVSAPAAPAVLQDSSDVEESTHDEPAAESSGRNVDSTEAVLSMTLGVLLVVAALFPRSIRGLLMLGIGGGLLYRGATGRCEVYKVLGVNTSEGKGTGIN